ncbi:CKLF-like MARVEL transmembrane domain-containing protein 2B isoform X1 [Peromyscus eremicus]|uniref:CKLF-like MARVEL transmembrane domain-containing protein 2B isoform X1 n=1 Tax=Peromyscus eremicus TaxID=42410 RepID=UPI0027DC3F4D|nr:CKLF-like MARVEL transmembrane domain-containing protein 2B isoform X1 [Peromyscus eremicus]
MATPMPKDDVGTRKGFDRYKWEFKDCNKDFWLGGHAVVKTLSIAFMIAGLNRFESISAHPLLILVLTMELSFFAFFMFLYTFAISRYTTFIYWPVTDLLNDLFTCVFLIGAIVFGVKSKSELTVTYIIALVLMAVAAFFALVDLCLQRRHFKPRKLRKLHVLAPDKFGKMPDPNLKLLLEQKEEEEAKQKEKEEKEKKEREAKLKAKQKKKQAKAKKGKKKK